MIEIDNLTIIDKGDQSVGIHEATYRIDGTLHFENNTDATSFLFALVDVFQNHVICNSVDFSYDMKTI